MAIGCSDLGDDKPTLEAPASIDFGSVAVGDSADTTVVISNSGELPLVISQAVVSVGDSGEFQLLSKLSSVVLGSGEDTPLVVRFKPNSEGVKMAILTIFSNDPNAESTPVTLTGTGGERALTITYDGDVGPIIGPGGSAGCLPSCHTGTPGSDGWKYTAIVNVASSRGMNYITPGDTSKSYLYLKIKGDPAITGSRMPRDNPSFFDDHPGDLQTIRDWIHKGAVER